jgi:hypothetical protein
MALGAALAEESMTPYLTDAEIEHITHPLTQGAARIRFFKTLGCKVKERPNGQPLVGRAEYEAVMTSRRNAIAPPASEVVRPDWDKLRAARNRA